MFRLSVALLALFALAACGGSRSSGGNRGYQSPTLLFATGPLQQACQSQGRKAASRARCGCIQAVADRTLSSADQRRGARYFKNPHALQEVRQSDNASNERFWRDWKAYGQRAAKLCSGS